MQMLKWIFLLALLGHSAFAARDGGEIGNAFVEFESKIGGYELEYPAEWRRTDLSQVTNFSDTKPSVPEKPDFLSVITSQMKGITTSAELLNHLRFFRPEVQWQKTTFAGVEGFQGEIGGVQTLYLLRGPENLLSVRYRANEGERSEKSLRHMLDSFRLF